MSRKPFSLLGKTLFTSRASFSLSPSLQKTGHYLLLFQAIVNHCLALQQVFRYQVFHRRRHRCALPPLRHVSARFFRNQTYPHFETPFPIVLTKGVLNRESPLSPNGYSFNHRLNHFFPTSFCLLIYFFIRYSLG